jgi:hypothetical protein
LTSGFYGITGAALFGLESKSREIPNLITYGLLDLFSLMSNHDDY